MKTIAFCGIDGAGKTTQIKRSQTALENLGYGVYVSKVAYYPFHNFSDVLSQFEMRMAMAFQFAKHYLELIPLLEKQKVDFLLCDRHYLCHLAFAATYGLDVKEIEIIERIFRLGGTPDLTLYFDIPLDVALSRIEARTSKARDADEAPEVLLNTLHNYKDLLSVNKDAQVVIIDANTSQEQQTEQILSKIKSFCV